MKTTRLLIAFVLLLGLFGFKNELTGQCTSLSIAVIATDPPSDPVDNTVCRGSTVTLLLTANGCELSTLNISWSPATQISGPPTSGPGLTRVTTVSLMTTTTFTATVTNTNGTTTQKPITINVVNNPSPGPIMVSPSSSVCEGTIVTLTAPSGFVGYQWDNSLGTGPEKTFSPQETTTYSVIVTDANGCTGNRNTTVTVNPIPNVSLPQPIGPFCLDTPPINLNTAVNPSPAGGTWSGPGVNGVNFNPSSAGVAVSPPHSLTYTVSQANCEGIGTINVIVFDVPNVTIQEIDPLCLNDDPINLNSVGDPSPSGGTWSGPGVNGANFSPSAAGVDTHTLTYSVNVAGCEGESTASITVHDIPNVSVGMVAPLCKNDAPIDLNMEANPNPLPGTWSGPGITGGAQFFPSASDVPSMATVTYTHTDNNGCSNSAETTIEVNPNPALAASVVGNTAICEGGPAFNLKAEASGGTSPYSYTWSPATGLNNSMIATPTASGLMVPSGQESEDFTFSVIAKDGKGCSSTEKSVTVTVAVQPSLNISGLGAACAGDAVTLTANLNGGIGLTGFQWEVKEDGASSWTPVLPAPSSVFTTPILDSSRRYRVSATFSGAGCTTAMSPEHHILVTTRPDPNIISFSGSNQICQNQISFFKVETPVLIGSSSFKWEIFGVTGLDTLQSGSLLSVNWGNTPPGTYTINVTEKLGVGDCKGEDSFQVTIVPGTAPDPAEIFSSPINNTLFYNDSSVTCYQWGYYDPKTDVLEDKIPGETYQSYVVGPAYEPERKYFVQVWNGDDNCNDPTCSSTIVFRSNEQPEPPEPEPHRPIALYPNPHSGNFKIEGNQLPEERYRLIIYSPLGQPIQEMDVQTPKGVLNQDLYLDNRYANGIYYLLLRGREGTYKTITFSLMR